MFENAQSLKQIEKSLKKHMFVQIRNLALCMEEQKTLFFYKTAARTFKQRIRGPALQYSPGEIMRNPYRQAVWGTN